MKINTLIIIIENYASGGANKYTEDIIFSLKDNFKRIEIWGNKEALLSFNTKRLPKDIILKSIYIFNAGELNNRLPVSLHKIFRMLLASLFFILNLLSLFVLKFRINSTKPDLILLCNGGYPASIYLDLAPFFIKSKFSTSMTIVSTPIRKRYLILENLWRKIDNTVQSYCENIIVNSIAIKNELVKDYHFSEKKIFILKNGIFDEKLTRKESSEIIQIGFIARIEKTKGIIELLEAYGKLKTNYKNIRLVIAGEGTLSYLVEEAAMRDKSINYLGYMNTGINELLHEIDIFVFPTYQEGLPYSIIEASMAECAIIASNVGGIPELIENNYSGILIQPKNSIALYVALENLIISTEKRLLLARNARLNFIRNLSIEKMQEQTKKILLKDL